MDREPRRHHYVPEAYLRGFTRIQSPRQIIVYDKQNGSSFPTSVRNAAIEKDYYRVPNAEDEFALEKGLSALEGLALPILSKLASQQTITQDERAVFAEFIAVMHCRGPAMRHFFAEVTAQMSLHLSEVAFATKERYERMLAQMEADGHKINRSVTYEQLVKFINNREGYSISIDRTYTLNAMTATDKMAQVFFDMKWQILRCPPPHVFFTSDNPVIYGSPKNTIHPIYGDGGLMNKSVEVTFPLTKRALMFITWDHPDIPDYLIPSLVHMFHSRTISQAFRYVYGPTKSEAVATIAKETFGHHRRLAAKDLPLVEIRRSHKER